MSFLKNLISKKEHDLSEEEKVKLDTILDNKNKPKSNRNDNVKKVEDDIKLKDIVEKLNLSQVNRMRELLDDREKKLYEIYGLEGEASQNEVEDTLKLETGVIKKNYSEVNVEENISDEDLNEQTVDIDEISEVKDKNIDLEIEDMKKLKKSKETEKNSDNYKEIEIDDESENEVLIEIKRIFGEENVFSKEGTSSKHEIFKDKTLLMIGVRKLDAFEKKESVLDQNAWFINHIKQFKNLKNFKMINSKPEEKELFQENPKLSILINYKATNVLKSKKDFSFE